MKQRYIDSAIKHFKEKGPKFTIDGDPIQYYKVYSTTFEYDIDNGDVMRACIRIGYSKGKCSHKDDLRMESDGPADNIEWSVHHTSRGEGSLYGFHVQSYNDAKKSDPTALSPNVYTIIGAGLLCLLLSTKILIAAGVGYCIYKTVSK